MDENLAKELCLSLIKADTEEEVIQLLRDAGRGWRKATLCSLKVLQHR